MRTPRDNDYGLIWERKQREKVAARKGLKVPAAPRAPIAPPASAWAAPTDFPSFARVKRLAVDTETKDPELNAQGPGCRRPGNHVVGLSFAHEGGKWYFPIRHEGGDNLDPDKALSWARHEMKNFTGEIAGANLGYDLDWAATEGIEFPNVKRFLDVQVAEPLLDENKQGQYNLNDLGLHHLGVGKNEDLLQQAAAAYGVDPKTELYRLPARYAGAYVEDDAARALQIIDKQLPLLEKEGLTELFYEVETPLIPILMAMRRRGVRVDINGAEEVRRVLLIKLQEYAAALKHLAGSRAEFMAPESFAHALKERGLKVPLTAKTKKPSITKDWLEANRADALVDAILSGRRINTIINTFLDGHILGHAIRDGQGTARIHCEFNQLKGDEYGTIARFSSSRPNLQNLPARDEELAPLIRGLFLPEEDETWERLDWSQIEYRFLAHYGVGKGAEECREAYRNDPRTDYHKLCAKMCDIDPEDKVKRKRVKAVNFAKGYGARADKLAQLLQCSKQEAEEFIAMYDRSLPFAKATFELADRRARKTGRIKTILGRIAHFDLWVPNGNYGETPLPLEQAQKEYGGALQRDGTYKALNRLLQGGAADLMKRAMVLFERAGILRVLGPLLVIVHDENDASRPHTKEGEEALVEMKRLMENCIELRVPVIAERESGPSWGAAK